jgi:transposase
VFEVAQNKTVNSNIVGRIYELMPKLGPDGIAVYLFYHQLARTGTTMSLKAAAKHMGMGSTTLSRTIDQLESFKLLRVTRPEGKERWQHATLKIEVLEPLEDAFKTVSEDTNASSTEDATCAGAVVSSSFLEGSKDLKEKEKEQIGAEPKSAVQPLAEHALTPEDVEGVTVIETEDDLRATSKSKKILTREDVLARQRRVMGQASGRGDERGASAKRRVAYDDPDMPASGKLVLSLLKRRGCKHTDSLSKAQIDELTRRKIHTRHGDLDMTLEEMNEMLGPTFKNWLETLPDFVKKHGMTLTAGAIIRLMTDYDAMSRGLRAYLLSINRPLLEKRRKPVEVEDLNIPKPIPGVYFGGFRPEDFE